MIYETNKVTLHGLVRSKERTNNRFIIKLAIGKDLRALIPCYVREEVYRDVEVSKVYKIEGFLLPKDEHNDNLALGITKYSLTDSFSDRQQIEVMFKITDSGFIREDYFNPNKKVRDLSVKFYNENIKNLDIEISLWSRLATLHDIADNRDAFASCYITVSRRTHKLKLIPHYFVILEGV